MSVTFQYEGLSELLAALRDLPQELMGEAQSIVTLATLRAATAVRSAYPEGVLRSGVSTSFYRDNVTVIGKVRSGARSKGARSLALLWEIGSEARHTAFGANRGRMPAHHTMLPIINREKTEMYDRLRQLLRDRGFEVSG